jgi:hypothetical protein
VSGDVRHHAVDLGTLAQKLSLPEHSPPNLADRLTTR